MMISIVLSFCLFSLAQQPRTMLVDHDVISDHSCLSLDGKTIGISGGTQGGGDWKVFDLTDGKCRVNGMDGKLRCWGAWAMAFSADGSMMAVGGNYNKFFLVNSMTGALIWDLTNEGHVSVITNVCFTPDGKYLISTGGDMMIRVWEIKNRKAHAVFRFTSTNRRLNQWQSPLYKERAKYVYNVEGKYHHLQQSALSPDGKTFALAGNLDRKIPLLDLASGKVSKHIDIIQETAVSLAFSSDGKWLVVGGPMENAKIEIYDVEKNKLVTSFGKHEWTVWRLAISPDKKTVLTGGVKDGFRVWDVPTGKQKFSYFTKDDPRMPRIKVFPDGSKYVGNECRSAGVAFLPDGKTFVLVPHWQSITAEVYFHDTATGRPVDYRKRIAALPKAAKAPR
ncbi:MAG: hypothetical protein HYX68_15615 [Planctomycetes bacterium]|nr:hypothetical protein [Planctomycetota bacterium]